MDIKECIQILLLFLLRNKDNQIAKAKFPNCPDAQAYVIGKIFLRKNYRIMERRNQNNQWGEQGSPKLMKDPIRKGQVQTKNCNIHKPETKKHEAEFFLIFPLEREGLGFSPLGAPPEGALFGDIFVQREFVYASIKLPYFYLKNLLVH